MTKDSSNTSVNQAEREGDYWNFGGIFRPVYLQAFPVGRVDRVAIKADANGAFGVNVYLAGSIVAGRVTAQIQQLDGSNVGAAVSAAVSAGATSTHLSTTIAGPRLWTAETPNLYQVQILLADGSGNTLHSFSQPFGLPDGRGAGRRRALISTAPGYCSRAPIGTRSIPPSAGLPAHAWPERTSC